MFVEVRLVSVGNVAGGGDFVNVFGKGGFLLGELSDYLFVGGPVD